MKKRVKLLNSISDVAYDHLPDERFEIGADINDPHGILVRSADCLKMEFGESLIAIARAGAGYNNIPVERCNEAGICVFNTPGGNANAVKELMLAAMIAAQRNLFDAVNWVTAQKGKSGIAAMVEKEKKRFVGPEIMGKRLGLIGLGAVGTLVANDAYSLGMEVSGYDPFISVDAAWKLRRNINRAQTVESLAASCDILSLHLPLNGETRGMINADVFSKMRKGTLLMNFARGELVDFNALRNALDEGIVSKYVTDFPCDEIMDMKNTVLIPHLAASTPESEENCASMAASELYDYLATGNIRNSVNFPNCELEPYEGGRLTFIHTNTPNMVGQITSRLARDGINIAHMASRSRGNYAYTMLDVDQLVSDESLADLNNIEGMIRIRTIKSAY